MFEPFSEAAASEAEIRPPSEDGDAETPVAETVSEIRPEDVPPKPKVSEEMKDRLRKELYAQGADPNKSAGNPILVVAGLIAILVVVGGKGETVAVRLFTALSGVWYRERWHA